MLNPLPVIKSVLCSYVAFLARQGLAPTTIKIYLSALRYAHIAKNIAMPQQSSMPKQKLVQQGVKQTHGFKVNNDKRLPAHLRLLHLGFFFRIGELTLPEGEQYSLDVHLSSYQVQ